MGVLPGGSPRSAAHHQVRSSQHRGPSIFTCSSPPGELPGRPRRASPAPLRARRAFNPGLSCRFPGALRRPRSRGVTGRLYLFTIRSVFFLSGARLQRIAWLKGCELGDSLTDSKPPPRRDGLAHFPSRPLPGCQRSATGGQAGARPGEGASDGRVRGGRGPAGAAH